MKSGLSIIIVTFNSRSHLGPCLDSLQHAIETACKPSEVIIIDNHSSDRTLETYQPLYPEHIWIKSIKNVGFGSACNRAVLSAQYSLLLFLNPDTLVQENTLQVMWDFYQKQQNVGVAGCRILNRDNTLQLACRRSFPTPQVAGFKLFGLAKLFPNSRLYAQYNMTYMDETKMHEVDAVSGSFLCIKKSLFDSIGGFDEDFFMYGEDLDLCYRAKLQGFSNFYTPQTSIIHLKGESAKSRPIRSLFHFYSAMIIFSKKHFELRFLPMSAVTISAFFLGIFIFFSSRIKKWPRILLDLGFLNLSLGLTSTIYANARQVEHLINYNPVLYLTWHVLLSGSVLSFIAMSEDYGKASSKTKKATLSIGLGVLAFFSIGYFFYEEAFSRIVFAATGILGFLMLSGWRVLANHTSVHFGKLTGSRIRMVIIGANTRGFALRELILEGFLPDYEFLGFIAEPGKSLPSEIRSEMIGSFRSLPKLVKNLEINEIILTLEKEAYQMALNLLSELTSVNVGVKILIGEPKPGTISLVDLNYSRNKKE